MKQIVGVVCLSFVLQGCFWSPAQAQTTDAALRAALIELIQKLQKQIIDQSVSRSRNQIELESGDQILSVYSSANDAIVVRDGVFTPEHQAYWTLVESIIPDSLTDRVHEVVFYSNENSITDAYVETLYGGGNDIWRLAVNYATYADDPDFYTMAELMIHEFGHVLSLNETQVYPIGDNIRCVTFETLEGCPRADSYYQELIDEFWSNDLLNAALDAEESNDQESAVSEYYEDYESYFVSEYAATNPGEDWAETFAVFVMEDQPFGNSVADKKVRSLYSYPELVNLRNQIQLAL